MLFLLICAMAHSLPTLQVNAQQPTLASQISMDQSTPFESFNTPKNNKQSDIETRFKTGQHAAQQMLLLRDRGISLEDPNLIHWQQLAINDLVNILNSNPNHRSARLLLSQVYYEAKMSKRLIGLAEAQRRQNPNDPEPYFYLSLALQDLGDTHAAYQTFALGMQRLQNTYLAKSMTLIEPSTQKKTTQSLTDPWRSRDPLFLTDVNERLKAHFSRVIYAEMRFADATQNKHGYQTDMGEMYVRYGDPISRIVRTTKGRTEEIWEYADFKLGFHRAQNIWTCAWGQTTNQQILSSKAFTAQYADQYQDPYHYQKYPISLQVGQFREPNGQTRLELYFALPEDEVQFDLSSKSLAKVNVQNGIFLFDQNWQVQTSSIHQITHMPRLKRTAQDMGMLLWKDQILAEPGTHQLAIETQDRLQSSIGTFRKPITISDYRADTLQMSNPLLAHRIQTRKAHPTSRDHYTILANPSGRFNQNADIAMYFETYNLKPNPEGYAQIRVRYFLKEIASSDNEPTSNWEPIAEKTTQHKGNSLSQAHQIQGGWLHPGQKAIRVQVEDLLSGQSMATEATFRVGW